MTNTEFREIVRVGLMAAAIPGMLSVAVSYMFYVAEFKSSYIPVGTTGLIVVVVLAVLLWELVRSYSGREVTAIHLGLVRLSAFLVAYSLFGLSPFVFYIIFAPIPLEVRLVGYIVGLGGYIWWLWLTYTDLKNALTRTNFKELAYEDDKTVLRYNHERWLLKITALMSHRKLPHQGQFWAALLVAPVAPFLGRLFAPEFSGIAVSTFVAYLSVPLGLWVLRSGAFQVAALIWYPLQIKRETGKTVIVSA